MTFTIHHAGRTDIGRERTENQDRWFADPKRGLYLVADGMGGGLAGGTAAQIVADTLPRLVVERMGRARNLATPRAAGLLAGVLAELSDRLRNESRGQPGLDGMGSTVVLALVRGANALIGHMGDSRAYLFRGGRLERLTVDHTIVQLLIESGDIRPEEAADHPSRGRLTRFVGMDGEALPESQLLKFEPGDVLLLCSDGLYGLVREEQIRTILVEMVSLDDACGRLVGAANEAGGKDNITAVILSMQ